MITDPIIFHLKEIKDVLGFETKKTIEDAIKDLENAFDAKN